MRKSLEKRKSRLEKRKSRLEKSLRCRHGNRAVVSFSISFRRVATALLLNEKQKTCGTKFKISSQTNRQLIYRADRKYFRKVLIISSV